MIKNYTYNVRRYFRTLKRIRFIWKKKDYSKSNDYGISKDMLRDIHCKLCKHVFFTYLINVPFGRKILHFSFKKIRIYYFHHPYLHFLQCSYFETLDFPYKEYLRELLQLCGLKLLIISHIESSSDSCFCCFTQNSFSSYATLPSRFN